MVEIRFLSNKTRKKAYTYIWLSVLAIISWLLQISVFSYTLVLDTTPSLIFFGCIFCGIKYGAKYGTFFGIISSFFSASILYDHIFMISYPVIGFASGIFSKNIFSDEIMSFAFLNLIFTPVIEALNGWQYSFNNEANILNRYLLVASIGTIINLFLSPVYYIILKFISQRLKVW